MLHDDYGVRHLLCEGGARVFANMLDAHLVDEEFVTLCPTFVGRSPDLFRPSYTEGVAWLPPTAPRSNPYQPAPRRRPPLPAHTLHLSGEAA